MVIFLYFQTLGKVIGLPQPFVAHVAMDSIPGKCILLNYFTQSRNVDCPKFWDLTVGLRWYMFTQEIYIWGGSIIRKSRFFLPKSGNT